MSVFFFPRLSSQSFKGVRFNFKRVKEVLQIGLPSLVQMGSLSVMSAVINNVLESIGGTLSLNAYAYIGKIIAFSFVPFTAAAQALAPFAGSNFGAGNGGRVSQAVRFSVLISIIYAAFALAVFEAAPHILMGIFTNDSEIISFGANGLKILAFSLIFTPLPILTGAAFQAVGKKIPALIMYSANLIFLIPLAFILSKYLGVNGVWISYTAASFLSAVTAIICLMSFRINVQCTMYNVQLKRRKAVLKQN
jgi:Na+-driven multidrug efflux pump